MNAPVRDSHAAPASAPAADGVRALVLAHRPCAWLGERGGYPSTALLRVTGRSLLVHALDDLSSAGVKEVCITLGDGADRVEAEIGDGSRLGLRVRYAFVRPTESLSALIARHERWLGTRFLVADASVLRSPSATMLLEASPGLPARSIRLFASGKDAGLSLEQRSGEARSVRLLDLPLQARPISSPRDYLEACLDSAAGLFPGLVHSGRPAGPSLTVGRQARMRGRHDGAAAWIGARSVVEPGVTLAGPVVVGEDCIVDRGATLDRCVVTAGTYIGRGVCVRDAVVCGDLLVPAGSSQPLVVGDQVLVSGIDFRRSAEPVSDAANRALAALLLLLSLPLWALALVASIARRPARPLDSVRLAGNDPAGWRRGRVEYRSWHWAARAPVLANLPRLLDAVRGHLRIVGVEPLAARVEGRLVEPWQDRRRWAPVGLVGPWIVDAPEGASGDERLVVDAAWLGTRTLRTDAGLALRAVRLLLTRRAWLATDVKMTETAPGAASRHDAADPGPEPAPSARSARGKAPISRGTTCTVW